MTRPERLLFPTDFSRCADQALAHALHLAGEFGAELHLLHAEILHEEDPYEPGHRFPDVEQLRAQFPEARDVCVRQAQLRGLSAAPLILQYARDHRIGLIVMGTHGRRGLGHLFLGSVAEEVVRLAPCPVLTIRERAQAVPPLEAIRRVLVPIDFSRYAREALAHAKEMAERYDASLQLLHVIEERMHPAFYNLGAFALREMLPDLEAKAQAALRDLLASVGGPERPAEVYVVVGRPGRDIVRFAARNDSDLIVIASHGLTGLEHLLLGSITEQVVRTAPCPVFTVKPVAAAVGSEAAAGPEARPNASFLASA